jgi:large subunit ribosomal protein L22
MAENQTAAKAMARNILIAPRKARIVIDLIRGKRVDEALAVLRFVPKKASLIIEKVLRSAVANAGHNYDLDTNLLFVAEAYVDQGPTYKRFHPRQRGQAFSIKKRTSHVTVVVRERKEG